jgi:hypothetical protein
MKLARESAIEQLGCDAMTFKEMEKVIKNVDVDASLKELNRHWFLNKVFLTEHAELIGDTMTRDRIMAALPDDGAYCEISASLARVEKLKMSELVLASQAGLLADVNTVCTLLTYLLSGVSPTGSEVARMNPFFKIVLARCTWFCKTEVLQASSKTVMFPTPITLYGFDAVLALYKAFDKSREQKAEVPIHIGELRRFAWMLSDAQEASVNRTATDIADVRRMQMLAPTLAIDEPHDDDNLTLAVSCAASSLRVSGAKSKKELTKEELNTTKKATLVSMFTPNARVDQVM